VYWDPRSTGKLADDLHLQIMAPEKNIDSARVHGCSPNKTNKSSEISGS